jgi:hypothetical protein
MHSSETQCLLYSRWLFELIDINDQRLCNICENVEIQIDLIEVLQSLLIVEKVSQLMILDMSYQAATSMMTQSDLFNIVNIEISSLHNDRKVKFQAVRRGSKIKFLLHLFQRLNSRRKRLMSNKTDVVSCHCQSEY